ncbi:hypothetical protein MSG28_012589 [Choristoneura fumiferana]|uniref:Uncharacterized protein n=1 Tax=Choristoneura fumiferana TaxID=7141 RepID=A0ACC0JH73_CHOFU|nr:hypothetical protein MSG28_012589 [Choristoneura fumiferana]
MEEVRQLVQEEGREARNLLAFHVAVDTPAHENLNECQEVILVLENYTRDFKALGEWFRLKWEYDNTPPPQRPQSLAWEIRKTDFVRPESRRTHSVKSSPSVSGKNSPCLSGHNTPSGKNSPSLTGKASPGSGKISPRVSSGHSTSPKANIEFFSNKIAASKVTAKPEPKLETKLTEIKEKYVNGTVGGVIEENDEKVLPVLQVQGVAGETVEDDILPVVELGKAKQCPNASPKPVVVKSTKSKLGTKNVRKDSTEELSAQAKTTNATLDAMETDFLTKQLVENKAKNENMLNEDIEVENRIAKSISKDKSVQNEATVEEKNSCNIVLLESLKDNDTTKIEQVKPNDDVIEHKLPSSDVVHNFEINGNTDASVEKDNSSSESLSKSDDNFADISNESSIKSVEDKQEKVDDMSELIVDENSKTDSKSMEKGIVQDCGPNAGCIAEKKTPIDLLKENVETSKDKEPIKNKDDFKDDKDFKKPEPKVETKLHVKPAYSQAAAKPKVIPAKTEVKTPTRATPLIRSKTAVEIRSNTTPKVQRQCPKRSITSKCSYPFNLTTGRPSLFDTSSNVANKGAVPKKVVNKNIQMGSGDAKVNQPKLDPKKRPLRPTTLKVNEKGDKKETANPALEKIKDCDEYSSSDTIVTQIDMSRIESSESLRTLVPDDLEMIHDAANSVEVLNVDSNKNDNDGWLTVKSRRLSRESKKHSKSHWSNRFHQPSATTSLPTLNMIESPKQEVKPMHAPVTPKVDRAKSEQPQTVKPEKVATAKNRTDTRRNLDMIRQKSDVTGLKRSARSKALLKKAEKAKDSLEDAESSELTKNRLHSSLESLTTGLARSQESTEEAFDFDKWKAEFKSTLKYLEDDDQLPNHNEILKTADPSEMSEIAEMTSQIEENEKKISWALDFQSEVDQRKLSEEEELLNRQIMELQQVSDIDLDTETDDTEISVPAPENLGSLAASLEDQYETALAGMSWAERVDTLVVLEALVARDPGRAQQLHAKLSQGIKRRGSFQDALRRLQAKQARAERQRLEYQTERAKKIHQLLARVEEVKVAKNQLIEEKRMRMERRLQKAAENRDQHLKEQKAAREAAVGARRQAIEAARQRHVQTLLERRKERDRQGVKSRLSALAAAAELEAVALRSRIRHKQDASQQRLEGNEQLFSENRVPIDPYTFPVANKMYKVVQQINNILAPLIEQKPPHTEENEEKLNGEDTENKKPKKKKTKKEASENNNNTEVTEKVEEVKESKKSKKKKKEDRAKLGKTESVCSSLSDMSRASGKSEKKNKVVIDMHYICLSGILRADTRGEVRAGIQTLVTVCCDLCTPYENHHSSECFAATQSLHVALGRGLCGARADLCMLFARGANVAECGGFESFMEGGYALEFRAAVARLLTQHAPTHNSMRLDHSLSETMVLDLIILIGFMVVNNPQLQMLDEYMDSPEAQKVKLVQNRDYGFSFHIDNIFSAASFSNSIITAKTIFGINGVKSVLVGHEFVTVTKQTDNQWMLMKPAIVAAITDFFANDLPVVTGAIPTRETQINEEDDETVRMIKEILDSKIRPRAQEDGGDAVFVDFKDGVLRLKMIGACSSCPNSVVTLKSGIQNMMQFYVPEVLSVERVDEVEHIEQSQANQFTE